MRFLQARWFTPANRKRIDLIVIHTMEVPLGVGLAQRVAEGFARGNRKVSAHYCIDPQLVIQCVREPDIAWHTPSANSLGIGLEHSGYALAGAGHSQTDWSQPQAQAELRLSAALAAELCKRWGIPIVHLSVSDFLAGKKGFIGHVEASNAFPSPGGHRDPGMTWPWDQYLDLVRGGPQNLNDILPPETPEELNSLMSGTTPSTNPTPQNQKVSGGQNHNLRYYDATTDKEVAVSPQFLEELKKYDMKTRTASAQWIAQGGAGAIDIDEDSEFLGDTLINDNEADTSLDDPVLNPIKQYDEFRGQFVGKSTTPEMDKFLDASGVGLEKILDIRDVLQYRKNANKWLQKRQLATSGQDKRVATSLSPQPPQVPLAPAKLNSSSPTDPVQYNHDNLERLLPYVKKWADALGIPVSLVCAIMNNESGMRPWVVNDAAKSLQGAFGVMQVTLGAARGLGFRGNPQPWRDKSEAVNTRIGQGKYARFGQLYLSSGGAELWRNQSQNQKLWEAGASSGDNNMGRNPQLGADIIHPETNIMLGCKLLQRKLIQAASFGCFTVDGLAVWPKLASDNNLKLDGPPGLSGERAIRWAMQMYNGDEGRIGYADRGLNFMARLDTKLPPSITTPPTQQAKEQALAQAETSSKGKGKSRQLSSFGPAFLDSIRTG